MSKRVFVTGGTGFVGQSVIEVLLARGFAVNALSRGAKISGVNVIEGDLFDPASLNSGLDDCEAVVHLVGIIREQTRKGVTFERIHVDGTRQVVDAMKRANVRRYVHMSALGTRPNAQSTYHQTKHLAEKCVRSSSLDWTILRPSMIHGPRGEFTQMEAAWAKRQSMPFLFMPYFGAGALGLDGAGKLQPVYVNDVARAFADAIANPRTIGQTYEVAGADILTWPELHHVFAETFVGKRRPTLAIPAWYAKVLTSILPRSLLPFNQDQVIMSQEDNTASELSKFAGDFGWTPRPFRETLAEYASEVRSG